MTNNILRLINRMIVLYGYESPIVEQFTEICKNEVLTESQLNVLVTLHEKFPQHEG